MSVHNKDYEKKAVNDSKGTKLIIYIPPKEEYILATMEAFKDCPYDVDVIITSKAKEFLMSDTGITDKELNKMICEEIKKRTNH